MALITCHFRPSGLGISTAMNVLIPLEFSNEEQQSSKRFPVLWLLHGGSGFYGDWLRFSEIEKYSNKYGIAVVMPDAQNSSYTDMAFGPKWLTYFIEELPKYIYSHFPISDRREDNFVSGMSMGGLGTINIGLACPKQYAAIAPMGSAVGIPQKYASGKVEMDWIDKFQIAVYGQDRQAILGGPNDCYARVKTLVESGVDLPKMLFCVGRNDFTYTDNVDYCRYLRQLGLKTEWIESDEGHTSEAWNDFLPKVFDWLPINR